MMKNLVFCDLPISNIDVMTTYIPSGLGLGNSYPFKKNLSGLGPDHLSKMNVIEIFFRNAVSQTNAMYFKLDVYT